MWPPQIKHEELDHVVDGYDSSIENHARPHLRGATFHLVEKYPLDRAGKSSPEDMAGAMDHDSDDEYGDEVESNRVIQHGMTHNQHLVPPLIVHRDQRGDELLDGNHRSALGAHAGVAYHPAYVHVAGSEKTAALDGPDWCAHRVASRCYYPGDRLPNGTRLGIPQDRGPCPWQTTNQQAMCPISEPGPMAVMTMRGAFTPTKRIFGRTYGLDHRLFEDEKLKPDVREYIMGTLSHYWAPMFGDHWGQWAQVYFAGSEASEWTSANREGNNDFDVLIGINYDMFRAQQEIDSSDEDITAVLNEQFRTGLMPFTDPVWILVPSTTSTVQSRTWENQDDDHLANQRSTSNSSGSTATRAGQLPLSPVTSGLRSALSATTLNEQEYLGTQSEGKTDLRSPQRLNVEPAGKTSLRQTHTKTELTHDAVKNAKSHTTETDTFESRSTFLQKSSTRFLPNKAEGVLSADEQTSDWWSITITSAVLANALAGSASEVSSAHDTIRRLPTSESAIFAPHSTTWSEENPPPAPDGFVYVGPMSNTFYVNKDSWDIRDIRPYAAYNVSRDEWAVKPPHLPTWDISKFPEGKALTQLGRAVSGAVKAVLLLPEPYRTQQAVAWWDHLHGDRSRAFTPQGEGWYDPSNVLEKWLDQEGLWSKLWEAKNRADQDPHALDAPADWSNDPSGVLPSRA